MTPHAMLTTALLLGAFVTAAGAYALLYCAARISDHPMLRAGGLLSYGALCMIAFALVAFTPLHVGWKVLIAVSCAAYLMIPPVAWRYLGRLHQEERIR
jgi:peptidoglycan/LPS O-acetylase OafA/YrhL